MNNTFKTFLRSAGDTGGASKDILKLFARHLLDNKER
jgi:hypothetical protein